MALTFVIASVLLILLSFANGANDVSKAIATLVGSKVASMRKAVLWGTLWTLAGGISGLYFGTAIIKNITQNIYTALPEFSWSVALAVGVAPIIWIALATYKKWPVSTTHAIVGGLLGAGVSAYGTAGIAWSAAFSKIALPLLASPLMAIGLAYMLSPFLQKVAISVERLRFCLLPSPQFALLTAQYSSHGASQRCIVCDQNSQEAATRHNIGISVDHVHWLTSGMLSFSRGLNDTPKLIAVILPFLLAGGFTAETTRWMYIISAVAMAVGGLLAGSRITEVLGFKVTALNHIQGFSANAVSSFLVLFASKLGLPVSTTHVSTCSIMGLGLSDGRGINRDTVITILFAWIVTVPLSALFATLIYWGVVGL